MICNTYLLIPVCLALTGATPVVDDTRALSEAAGKEITPSRPPEDLVLEDDADESPEAETYRGARSSFMERARNYPFDKKNKKEEESKNYSLPIVEENSVRFFDVSAEEDLILEANGQNVTGIRASGPECRLVNLEVRAGYVLHEELRDKCKKLRNLTLAGNNWRCAGTLHHFVEAMEDRISYDKARCGDIKCPTDQEHRYCSLEVGMNLTKTYGLKEIECPPVCVCSMNLYSGLFHYMVNCVKANITDETIPPFPQATMSLDLSQNKLTSTEPLFKKLSELKNLQIVFLGDNQLESVPYFKNNFAKLEQMFLNNNNIKWVNDSPDTFSLQLTSTEPLFKKLSELKNLQIVFLGDNQLESVPYFKNNFAKLEQMFLNNNNIKWLEAAAIKSILQTKNKDFRIELLGNPLECGPDIYEINFLQAIHYKLISNWKKIKCTDGEKEKFVKFYIKEDSKGLSAEFDPLVMGICLLGAMNLFLMYVIYDLWMAKREMRKTMAGRRPLLDRIVCGATVCCGTLFSRSFWRTEEEPRGSSDACYESPDQVAIRKRTPKAARANASEKNEL
ncbi:uncharacterized protein LOC134773060 [Penaeus indicus]|uniref:uncharacterized protein LOC134773060 n=1 Tax=Penaeus indicus TaxID=29960 RepID=UPI00300C10FF